METCRRAPSTKIDVEFGEVQAGSTAVKWIEIANECHMEQMYEARRDAATNPLDHVFELSSYTWTLSPGQVYKCKLHYRPFVPFSINIDYFMIVASNHARTEVKVRGTCIGPVISSSTTRLVMICACGNAEAKKRIKLVNDSRVAATFMFDIDQIQRPFTVDTTHGHIGPHSCKYVTVTFAPRQNGIYTCHLPCLILNHKPIIVELYGYCGSALRKADTQERFNYPARSKSGFEGYMSDTVVLTHDLPAISLSKNYIDFARASTRTNGIMQNVLETLCLTNHSQSDVLIRWDQDVRGIFNIKPVAVEVPANKTVLFEVTFRPNKNQSNLYATELIGCVFQVQEEKYPRKETFVFPAITSVRLIGYFYSACSDGWIPQYDVPHVVKMPACAPSFPVYTTFAIKRFGHLPLMYRFVPPPTSHFFVKPMMGIIHQDYQIFVVGMLPEADDERVYVERWAIRFNGNAGSECFIDFRGFAERAKVVLNDHDALKITPCYPGCHQPQRFTMRNVTRHTIKYEFVNTIRELEIPRADGEIYSNDIVDHKWGFRPTTIGDYEFDVHCILTVPKDDTVVGTAVSVTLRVIGRCEVGFLVSAPDELDFGTQAYGTTKELSFHVFNLSPVTIFYIITRGHCNWPIRNIEGDVKVHPSADVVYAGQYKAITVSVTPSAPGCYQLFVRYCVRPNVHARTPIPNQTPRNICRLRYLCVLPTLKVKDLRCCGPCPVASKTLLWKMMKINRFNDLLKNLQPSRSETLRVNYPAMVLLPEHPVIVKLLLKNVSAVAASWNVTRVRLCSCRPVAKVRALSFRRAVHDCPHRRTFDVRPKTGSLQPGKDTWITVELRYVLLGKTEARWDLDLGNNRHIFLAMAIEGLSGTESKLQLLSDRHLAFQHTYFGDKDPIYQICWVYNGADRNIPFSVSQRAIRETNHEHHHELFSCATLHGVVSPQSPAPILLRFQPRRFGIFQEKLTLKLGDAEEELKLHGVSSLPHTRAVVEEYVPSYVLRAASNDDSEIPVYLNTYCINVSRIATHSHVVRMIIMHNDLEQDVFSYEWKRREYSGIIRVQVYPQKGVIRPGTVQTFLVTVNTGGYPCMIDVNVPCEFINVSQMCAYQRSVYKHADLSRELKEQFTITEKGMSVPKPTIQILEKPRPFYKVITIRCSIYSSEDKFLKVTLTEELKGAPPHVICLEKNEEKRTTLEREDVSRASFILEGLLWDIINSKLLRNLAQDVLQNKSNVFYSQFSMNPHKRKRLVQRSYISPPRELISRILENTLLVIMHEEFSLDVAHLIQQTDIRHTNYLNIVSRVNRRKTLQQEVSSLHQVAHDPAILSKQSVSFLERLMH